METISNVASAASKAIWGESDEEKKKNESGEEPVSGQTGTGGVDEPYDAGNLPEQDSTKADAGDKTEATSTGPSAGAGAGATATGPAADPAKASEEPKSTGTDVAPQKDIPKNEVKPDTTEKPTKKPAGETTRVGNSEVLVPVSSGAIGDHADKNDDPTGANTEDAPNAPPPIQEDDVAPEDDVKDGGAAAADDKDDAPPAGSEGRKKSLGNIGSKIKEKLHIGKK